MQFTINPQTLPLLQKRISQINNTDNEYAKIELIVHDDTYKVVRTHTLLGLCGVKEIQIELLGIQTVVGNHQVLAAIEIIAGNPVVHYGYQDIPTECLTTDLTCAFCGKVHKSKKVYIVHTEGQTFPYRIISNVCINDAIHNKLTKRLSTIEKLLDIILFEDQHNKGDDFTETTFKAGKYGINTMDFLYYVLDDIFTYGYVSRTTAHINGKVSTADKAIANYFNQKVAAVYSEKKAKIIKEALDWIKQAKITSQYIFDLQYILSFQYIDHVQCGYAASLFNAHEKSLKRTNRKPIYIGKIGARITCRLRLSKELIYQDDFRKCAIYTFVDRQYNEFIWRSDKAMVETHSCRKYLMHVTFTVRAHVLNRDTGVKQTEITNIRSSESFLEKKNKTS
jgi:hypothetical protein